MPYAAYDEKPGINTENDGWTMIDSKKIITIYLIKITANFYEELKIYCF